MYPQVPSGNWVLCHSIGTNLRVAPQGSQGHVPELSAVLPWVTWQQLSRIDKWLSHHLVVAPTFPRVSLHAVGLRQLLFHGVLFQKHTEPFHTGMDFLSFRLKGTAFLTQPITLSFCLVLVYIVISKCLTLAPPTILWARSKYSLRHGRCGHPDSSPYPVGAEANRKGSCVLSKSSQPQPSLGQEGSRLIGHKWVPSAHNYPSLGRGRATPFPL